MGTGHVTLQADVDLKGVDLARYQLQVAVFLDPGRKCIHLIIFMFIIRPDYSDCQLFVQVVSDTLQQPVISPETDLYFLSDRYLGIRIFYPGCGALR